MVINNVLLVTLAYLVGISLLLVLNEANYRWLKMKGEYSRKMAHVLATLATVPFPYLFTSHWYVFGLAFLFFGVLYFSQRYKQLNSIHEIGRRSIGSYLLPASIYLTFLIYTFTGNPVIYIIPITILAVCDPVAALVGMSVKTRNVKLTVPWQRSDKTLVGSLAFYVSSMLISIGLLNWFGEGDILSIIRSSLVIALIGTLAELISFRGSDNLTIPLSVQLTLLWLI